MKKISIVIPAYNEAENIAWFHKELTRVIYDLHYEWEIVYVDDGSTDTTRQELYAIAAHDSHVQTIILARNFGKEAALSAGIIESTGDAVIALDADGQHPPKMIPRFLREWEDGSQVVIGVRRANQGEGFIKRYGSKLYYGLLRHIVNQNIVPGSTDFRLIDKEVVDNFRQMTEKNRMTRYVIDWLGYDRSYIEFTANQRHAGEATYTFSKLMKLALNGFISQSTLPLRLSGYIGTFLMVASFFGIISILFNRYILNDALHWGITNIAVLSLILLFFIGLVLGCIGLLALYIENIHDETRNRPLYIINRARSRKHDHR